MTLYNNKYRIESTRLQNWDYSWSGAYYITICTKNKIRYFGEIENAKMKLSPIGAIADVLWYEIKHHAKNIELGEWVIMPDHMHGILILTEEQTTHALSPLSKSFPQSKSPLDSSKTIGQQRFQNQGKNTISSIVGGYKSAVTKHANRLELEFAWHTRFHDHIIRDARAFQNISNYIRDNPRNWGKDDLNGGQ